MVSLLDLINSISYTDNIQDVRTRTVGRKVTFYRSDPLVYGPEYEPTSAFSHKPT